MDKRNETFRFYLANILNFVVHLFCALIQTLLPFLKRKKSVRDEIVLITGAGSGIGQLMSAEFAKLGAIIVAWDINHPGLEKTKSLVEQNGSKCYIYNVDVTDRFKVYEIAQKIKQDIGTVYMLINNAGIVVGRNLLEIKDEEILRTMNVNSISHFWTIKAFLPDMIERNRGHIVTIASLAGHCGTNKLVDYSASKFAAIGIDASLRLELEVNGHNRVKTTVVCPWFINTGMFEGSKGLIPNLEPKDVTDQIVKAILKDQEELVIPKIMYFYNFLKNILPVKCSIDLVKIVGVHKSMDLFVGNNKKKIN